MESTDSISLQLPAGMKKRLDSAAKRDRRSRQKEIVFFIEIMLEEYPAEAFLEGTETPGADS